MGLRGRRKANGALTWYGLGKAERVKGSCTHARHEETECASQRKAHSACHDRFREARFHSRLHLRRQCQLEVAKVAVKLMHTILTVACSCSLIPPAPAPPPYPGMPG